MDCGSLCQKFVDAARTTTILPQIALSTHPPRAPGEPSAWQLGFDVATVNTLYQRDVEGHRIDSISESARVLEIQRNIEQLQFHMLAVFELRSRRTEVRHMKVFFVFASQGKG